ncbi:MAG TPA: hypothetical protein VI172_09920 [Candidatus Dormibacteraeota bacterium]
MTRWLALLGVIAIAASACTRPFQTPPPAKIMDVYAASPSSADAASLLGGTWWTSAPTFSVRPLDDANQASQIQYSVIRRFANVGTAETWEVTYIQLDKSSSASTLMSNIENNLGSGTTGKSVGDKALYYQQKLSASSGSEGAAYEALTFIRVGSLIIESVWKKNDSFPSSDQLGKVASRLASGAKNAIAGKVHAAPASASDLAMLPPPNSLITLLGAVTLPIEAMPLMVNAAAPTQVLQVFQSQGVNTFVYGDYVLNSDTQMEVQAAVFTLPSASAAEALFDSFKGDTTVDANGVLRYYNETAGPGQYDYFIASGRHLGLLICRSVQEETAHAAASRACETPLETVSAAWPSAFSD